MATQGKGERAGATRPLPMRELLPTPPSASKKKDQVVNPSLIKTSVIAGRTLVPFLAGSLVTHDYLENQGLGLDGKSAMVGLFTVLLANGGLYLLQRMTNAEAKAKQWQSDFEQERRSGRRDVATAIRSRDQARSDLQGYAGRVRQRHREREAEKRGQQSNGSAPRWPLRWPGQS